MKQIAPTQLQRLRILLEGYAGGPLPDFEQFAKGVGEVTIPARHTLVAAGDHHPYIYLVNRGLSKTVYTPQPGAPRILAFTDEDGFVASLSALGLSGLRGLHAKGFDSFPDAHAPQTPGLARSSIVSLEACTMWRADYTLIEHLAERHVRWASLVITFLASHLVHLTNDLYAMRADDAEARYRHLLTYRPSLAERVTQRDMAAYLGVTQTSMSRIVTRIRAPRTTPARDDED